MTFKSHRIPIFFGAATLTVILLLIFALVSIYFKFGDYVVGNIKTSGSADILTPLDHGRLERAVKRMEERQNLPYAPSTIHNPFNAIPTVPPPSPPAPASPSGH